MTKIEPVLLSTEDAARTATYLRELSDRFPDVPVRVQALFGRCCLAAAGYEHSTEALGGEAAALGERILNDPEPHRLDLDPLLLIEIHQMLKRAGAAAAAMHRVIEQIASALQAQPAETQRAGRVRNMASHLASLGLPARPAGPSREMARLLSAPGRWFGASVAELAEIPHHLVADGRPLDDMTTRILSLLALAELRNYRIDLGCTLLRAVFQLGENSPESTDALNFIALQRRRDGRYGFPNQFAESPELENGQHLSLYLPLTVNAVWLFRTEAERRRQWQPAAIA
jgi:hypothetical protein